MDRRDPKIQKRIDQIKSWLGRKDFNEKQRLQAVREISALSDELLNITPPFDGFNSNVRHLQTVKFLDAWYASEIQSVINRPHLNTVI